MLGLGAMLLASRTDFRVLRFLAIPLYIGTLALLIAVLIPGIGYEAFGSRRWIVILGIGSFQPAELAKLAICIYLAHWLDRRGSQARSFWNGFVPFGLLVAPGFLLIALEPDLGTAGVYAITALSIFFMAGANLVYLGAIAAGVVGAAVVMISSTPYQMERVRTFLDPFRDPLDAGYNTIQGLLALALGGVVGQGLGASRMKYLYLPAPSTDFIFAIIGEEWGLLGHPDRADPVRDARVSRLPDRDQRAGYLLRPAGRRDHHLAGGPGLRQHDGRHRPDAGHRHPAALHQLRRVGAHPEPRGGRHPAVDLARDHPDRILARCGIWCRAAGQAGTCTPRWPSRGPCATRSPSLSSPTSAASVAWSDGS